MRAALTLICVAALAACGVDGEPVRPGDRDELTPPPNASPDAGGDWIGGTASMHTGARL